MDQATHSKIGYEILVTLYFPHAKPFCGLGEVRADILAVQNAAEGLMDERVKVAAE